MSIPEPAKAAANSASSVTRVPLTRTAAVAIQRSLCDTVRGISADSLPNSFASLSSTWLWTFRLVPRLEAEMGEDFSLLLGYFGREGLGGAVDDDGGAAQRSELFDELADGQPGPLLDGVGDGQGGEHDGQVRLDGLPHAVEHRSSIEIGLRHA